MNVGRAVSFFASRAAPFVVLAIYDYPLLKLTDWVQGLPYWIEFVTFWGINLVIPAIILLAGGYFVRQIPPRSKFNWVGIAFSAAVAVLNPFVTTCGGLALAGGACT